MILGVNILYVQEDKFHNGVVISVPGVTLEKLEKPFNGIVEVEE